MKFTEEWKEKWLFSPNLKNIIILIVGSLIDLCGRWFSNSVSMPFWLDCIGTFLCAVLLGPLGGAVTGLVYNIVLNFFMPGQIWFAIVSVAGGLAIGRLFPHDRKIAAFPVVAASIYAGLIMVVVSTPLNMLFNHGYIGNPWGDALVEMLSPYINVGLVRCILGGLFISMPDKALSMLIVMLILFLFKKKMFLQADGAKAANMILFCILVSACSMGFPAKSALAADINSEYMSVLYGEEDGLASAEINTIAQTDDGYIWVGAYSGLYRYNGAQFVKMNIDKRISNVTYLFEDSKGILWLGTNDSGVFSYDRKTKRVSLYSTKEGLSANSVRSVCEGEDGKIYVSTAAELCSIDQDGKVFVYRELSQITCVYNLNYLGQDMVSGVTQNGLFFILEGEQLLYSKEYDGTDLGYSAAAYDGKGTFLAGTTGGVLELFFFDGKEVKVKKKIETEEISMTNFVLYDEEKQGFFVAAASGFCFVDTKGNLEILTKNDFSNSVSHSMVDYQGNIWFVSTKQGVLKLAKSPFTDVLRRAGMVGMAVNATLLTDRYLYIGTDAGLFAVKKEDSSAYHPVWSEKFENVRVRQLMQDRNGNIWVSTYGQDGLGVVSPSGEVRFYNGENSNILGSRFRFTLELKNGDIVAFSTDGISFLHDGAVTKTVGMNEGLSVPQILSAVETEDGKLLAGSDGDGIYVIENGAITDHIDGRAGLNSLIILRIVACEDGYLYVTSNGIYYDEKDGKLRKLENFPYSNNYDIYVSLNGEAFVSGSAGIYVVRLKDMLEEGTLAG